MYNNCYVSLCFVEQSKIHASVDTYNDLRLINCYVFENTNHDTVRSYIKSYKFIKYLEIHDNENIIYDMLFVEYNFLFEIQKLKYFITSIKDYDNILNILEKCKSIRYIELIYNDPIYSKSFYEKLINFDVLINMSVGGYFHPPINQYKLYFDIYEDLLEKNCIGEIIMYGVPGIFVCCNIITKRFNISHDLYFTFVKSINNFLILFSKTNLLFCSIDAIYSFVFKK